jgi:hypothetical protein
MTFTYPKIETLYNRDARGVVIEGDYRNLLFPVVKYWQVTEKIDGTNIRVELTENGEVNFYGRKENSQIPQPIVNYLTKTFTKEKMQQLWISDEKYPIILFGEGYGKGIQKAGELYRNDVSFRLFDVVIFYHNRIIWLDWEDIRKFAWNLQINTVPFLGEKTLGETMLMVKDGFYSSVAIEDSNKYDVVAEGVVAKSPFYDRNGNRVIFKLKTKDFRVK